MSQRDLFGDEEGVCESQHNDEEDNLSSLGTPTQSSGISGIVQLDEGQMDQAVNVFKCDYPNCNTVLKTKTGFLKHKILHKIKDANTRRPSFDELAPVVEPYAQDILREILLEPNIDIDTVNFINGILNAEPSPEWFHFLSSISSSILDLMSSRTKLMPCNQYEDHLKYINHMLNDDSTFQSLESQLFLLNKESKIVSGARIIFRVVTGIYEKIHLYVLKEMRSCSSDSCSDQTQNVCVDMSNTNPSPGFLLHLRKLLRLFCQKCSKANSPKCVKKKMCILRRFVRHSKDEPVTLELFLQDTYWEADSEEDDILLKLTDECWGFFFYVEEILKTMRNTSDKVTCDTLFEILFEPQNSKVLDLWSSLTDGFFNESESVEFMNEMVSIMYSLSSRLELERLKRAESSDRAKHKHALRVRLT